MQKFKKWLVHFDINRDDLSDLQKVAQVASFFVPDEIHITFFPQQVDLPSSVLSDMPDLKQANAKQQEDQILTMIKKAFHPELSVKLQLLEGKPLPGILNYAVKNKFDLFVLTAQSLNHSNSLSRKLVRKVPASILRLPIEPIQELSHVFFPVDFSEHNDLIKKLILSLHKEFTFRKVEALHVYKDASRYLERVFETADEIKGILAKRTKINEQLELHANHQIETYFESIKSPEILCSTQAIDRGEEVGVKILSAELSPASTLMVFGSKGESASIASLMGGVAEHLVMNSPYLSLMVKLPEENRGFLKSLLSK